MEKEYIMHYRPDEELFELYIKTGNSFAGAAKTGIITLLTEIPGEDLELQVKIESIPGSEERLFVCDIPKIAAYNPELALDVMKILDKGRIIFAIEHDSGEFRKEIPLSENHIRDIREFMELD